MGSGVKCVDHVDPRGPAASCYIAYQLCSNWVSVIVVNVAIMTKFPVH